MGGKRLLCLTMGLVLVALLVAGCSAGQAAPGGAAGTEAAASSPIPPTATVLLSSAAAPTAPPPIVVSTVEPPTTGTVRGVLTDKGSAQPLSGVGVTLGTVEYDADGQPAGYEVSAEGGQVLRSAYTGTDGAFTIEAPAGVYALVSPGGSTNDQIARDASGRVLIVKVEAGRTVDLGTIEMDGSAGAPPASGGTITGVFVDKAGAALSGWLWLAAMTGKKDTGEDSYEGAAAGEYKDYIRVGATGGLLSGSHEFMTITPGGVIDLGTIQVDY